MAWAARRRPGFGLRDRRRSRTLGIMLSAFDDPRARKSVPPPDDDDARREEAAREVTEWLFDGRPMPTEEELEAIGREWQD